ncbi:hypothetical protein, partial [Nosocomiicoccus sp. HMSC059G07]|uniref:hypothetical protein n=1 Tax=Nosocomiicoccus sp. HMSC059G07 TaxID=1739531 RepID=UPI0008A44886
MENNLEQIMTITAFEIEAWADSIKARSHLPVLLRKLIHSTCSQLGYVDFPGYDNSQRQGSDGVIKEATGNSWVPKGDSYWEFGTDKNVKQKITDDFNARLNTIDKDTRKNSTFVFVTPRNWTGKSRESWIKEKSGLGEWKDIIVYDANDLEQWLENSIPTKAWFKEILGLPVSGLITLDRMWENWSNVTLESEQPIPTSIFESAISEHKDIFLQWITKDRCQPFNIRAHSSEEGLAFLSVLFNELQLKDFRDRTLIFNDANTLRYAITNFNDMIVIVNSKEVLSDIGNDVKKCPTILVNIQEKQEDNNIVLDLLEYSTIQKVLTQMGYSDVEKEKLIIESGKSATILRRKLSHLNHLSKAKWAIDRDYRLRDILMPLALIGTWDSTNDHDWKIVEKITGKIKEDIEKTIIDLAQLDDSPVWRFKGIIGVLSSIDVFNSFDLNFTRSEIEGFLTIVKDVLSEKDPALDLSPENRMLSALYNKNRKYSSGVRKRISENFAFLAAHDEEIISLHGFNFKVESQKIIKDMVMPLDYDKLYSQSVFLSIYSEIAPKVLSEIILKDVRSTASIVKTEMKPTKNIFIDSTNLRPNILWAIECLAADENSIINCIDILCELSKIKLEDNLHNKPVNSLLAVFNIYIPQISFDMNRRLELIEYLKEKHTEVFWEISVKQITRDNRSLSELRKPVFKKIENEFPSYTEDEIDTYFERIVEFMINIENHTIERYEDLLNILPYLKVSAQRKIIKKINDSINNLEDKSKAFLRSVLRSISHRQDLSDNLRKNIKVIYKTLEPENICLKNKWLFDNSRILLFNDMNTSRIDVDRVNRINNIRLEAINEVWKNNGLQGIVMMIDSSFSAKCIGHYLGLYIRDTEEYSSVFEKLFSNNLLLNKSYKLEFLKELLKKMEEETLETILSTNFERLSIGIQKEVLTILPLNDVTLNLLTKFNGKDLLNFWHAKDYTDFINYRGYLMSINQIVELLLSIDRDATALMVIREFYNEFESNKIIEVLRNFKMDQENDFKDRENLQYNIFILIKSLSVRGNTNHLSLLELELKYLMILDIYSYEFNNIKKSNLESPNLFIEIIEALIMNNNKNSVDTINYYSRLISKLFLIESDMDENFEIELERVLNW